MALFQRAAQCARSLVLPARRFGFYFKEEELEEKFQRGSGPGGQATNKSQNCVMLRHIPTGIVIRTFDTRLLEENRKIARQRLDQKLDVLYNGDQSAVVQAKKLRREKMLKAYKMNKRLEEKRKKLLELRQTLSHEEMRKVKDALFQEEEERKIAEERAEELKREQEYRERCLRKEQELHKRSDDVSNRTLDDK